MMSKSVAVKGDVSAEASLSKAEADTDSTGSWSAGPVTETAYAQLTINDVEVIYKAQCTFTYSGAAASGSPVDVPSETLTLEASPHNVMKGLNSVLVDGDEEVGPTSGNKLVVSASSHMTTA